MNSDSLSDALTPARHTAAKLLAAAVLDLFPGTLLVQGQGTSRFFFYDFLFADPLQPTSLPLLEERMRRILKQKPEIRVCEMVPANAAARMDHALQPLVAASLRARDLPLVQMVQIGAFFDVCDASDASPLTEWDPRYLFKLLEVSPLPVGERKGTRIIGVLSLDKSKLKECVRLSPSFTRCDSQRLCQDFKLLAPATSLGPGFFSWLPRGEKVLHALLTGWRAAHQEQGFQFLMTPSSLLQAPGDPPGRSLTRAHSACFLNLQPRGLARFAEVSYVLRGSCSPKNEGLLQTAGWLTDRAHLFCRKEELLNACISSLQFIVKIPKILGFEFQIVLYTAPRGAQSRGALQEALKRENLGYSTRSCPHLKKGESYLSLCVPDLLGRWWEGAFLSTGPEIDAEYVLLTRSAFASVERWVALALEAYAARIERCEERADVLEFLEDRINALNGSKDSELEN